MTTIDYHHGGDKAKRRAIRAQVKAMAWEALKRKRKVEAELNYYQNCTFKVTSKECALNEP